MTLDDGDDGEVGQKMGHDERMDQDRPVELAPSQRLTWCDRWAAGELGLREQRRLIAYYSHHLEDWRELAVAFVEAQAWEDVLRIDAPGGPPEEIVPTLGTDRTADLAGRGWDAAARPAARVERHEGCRAAHRADASRADWHRMLERTLAVGLMIMTMSVGWWWGSHQRWDAPQAATSRPAGRSPSGLGADGQRSDDPGNGGTRIVSVPLVRGREVLDLATAARWASPPDGVLEDVQRAGYDVQVRHRLVTARDPDGRPLLIPVSDTEIRAPQVWSN